MISTQERVSWKNKLPLLATILVIAVNAAANILPINGFNTGQLSDLYPTGVTPAGYVFSIWGVIYLGLCIFSFSAFLGSVETKARIEKVQNLFLVNALLNSSWIFSWHYRQITLSLVIMLALLATLVGIFWKLYYLPRPNWREYFSVDAPFSLYFGWITAATLLNLAALFFDQSYYPFNSTMEEWALITACLATAIYIWMGAVTRDVIYCGVFVWAAVGIFNRTGGITEPVRLAALCGAVAVTACILWVLITPRVRAMRLVH